MRVYYYVMFACILMAIFFVAGLDLATSSWVFNKLGLNDLANKENYLFWGQLIAIFAASATASIIIGSFSYVSPMFIFKATFIMTPLIGLIADFISILIKLNQYTNSWIYWAVWIFFVPIIGGYTIALISFWEGAD